jgi:hypothetical protein
MGKRHYGALGTEQGFKLAEIPSSDMMTRLAPIQAMKHPFSVGFQLLGSKRSTACSSRRYVCQSSPESAQMWK